MSTAKGKHEVAAQLEKWIREGIYGSSLPPVPQLASALDVSHSTIKNAAALIRARRDEVNFDLIPKVGRNGGGYRIEKLRNANVTSHSEIEISESLHLHSSVSLDEEDYRRLLADHPFINDGYSFSELKERFDGEFGVLSRIRVVDSVRVGLQVAFCSSDLLARVPELKSPRVSLGEFYKSLNLTKREHYIRPVTCSGLISELLQVGDSQTSAIGLRQLTYADEGELLEVLHGIYTNHYQFKFVTTFN